MTKRVPRKEPVREQFRSWGQRLTSGAGAIPVVAEAQDRRIGKVAAWSVLLGLYVLFFGRGTYLALSILMSGEPGQGADLSVQRNIDHTLFSVSRVLLIIILACFVL